MGQPLDVVASRVDRLHKVMAQAGVASRRASEELIAAGRVRVNGQIVSEPGCKVDPATDTVEVDGKELTLRRPSRYVMLHKPAGFVTTSRDPQGRPTVLNLVESPERIFPVGRLDQQSEGLLLLTNDGELAQQLTHPSYEHEKEYHVLVQGQPSQHTLRQLSTGIDLDDGPTWPARISLLRSAGPDTWLRWVMHEGRNRQIRRMCDRVKHRALRIIRVRVGPLELGSLKTGRWRALTPVEVARLRQLAAAGATDVPAARETKAAAPRPAAVRSPIPTEESEV